MIELNGRYKGFLGKKFLKVQEEWDKEQNPKRHKWLHCILLANKGVTVVNIALIEGYSKRQVQRLIKKFKNCERLRDFKPDYKPNRKKNR